MINHINTLELFDGFLCLTLNFNCTYLTPDDNFYSRFLNINGIENKYFITVHKKPFGYTITFIFNHTIKYRIEDKSKPALKQLLTKFIYYLQDNHEELFTEL